MESTTSAVFSAVTGTVAMTAAYAYAQRDWLKDQWLAFISPAIYNFLMGTTREQRALKYLKGGPLVPEGCKLRSTGLTYRWNLILQMEFDASDV